MLPSAAKSFDLSCVRIAHRSFASQPESVLLQILPAGASKGRGVQQLLRHLDVQPERVLAMGDGENDKVMLQVCELLCSIAKGANIDAHLSQHVYWHGFVDATAVMLRTSIC